MTTTIKPSIKRLKQCKTKEQIAWLLRKTKCKGVRHDHANCPLARYVKKATHKGDVSVGGGITAGDWIIIGQHAMDMHGDYEHFDDFVNSFDDGHYPGLELVGVDQ